MGEIAEKKAAYSAGKRFTFMPTDDGYGLEILLKTAANTA